MLIVLGLAAVSVGAVASGMSQHTGHPTAPQPTAPGEATQPPPLETCRAAAHRVIHAIDTLGSRVEGSRQTNSPLKMRESIDDVQNVLADVRAQIAPCASLAAAERPSAGAPAHMDHPQMAPGTPAVPPGSTAPAPPTAGSPSRMDHSKMDRPSAGRDAREADQEHAGHPVDPVCAMKVDPKTAPQATYRGKTYSFCSEQDRQKFLANPEKYVAKSPR